MKNKILISGVTGFVGVNLAEYLKEMFIIKGVSRRKRGDKYISYSDLKIDDFNNSKVFIHLAGKAHDLKKTSDDSEYFTANFELTKNLFDQFLESNCDVFIYMSSVKAVADYVEGVLTEDEDPTPVTAYGKSKLAAEDYINSIKVPSNKRVYILRPCMIHGPNNKGNLNLLYNFVIKGIPYPLGNYNNRRSFLSVKNLCFIVKELIDNKEIKSGVYNLSDDLPLSTKKLVTIIGQTTGKRVLIFNIPKFVIKTIAKIGDIFPIPLNSERVQKLTENYVVSNEKIKSAIKKELPLTVEGGIKITIKSYNN